MSNTALYPYVSLFQNSPTFPHSSMFPRQSPEYDVCLLRETLIANGEFTPAMEEVFKDSCAEQLTGERACGKESYRISKKYPKECARIAEVGLNLVCPGFMEETRASFDRSRPLYERIITKSVDFIKGSTTAKVLICGGVGITFFFAVDHLCLQD